MRRRDWNNNFMAACAEYADNIALLSMEQRGVLLTAAMANEGLTDPPEMDATTSFFFRILMERSERISEIRQARTNAGKMGGVQSSQVRWSTEEQVMSDANMEPANQNGTDQTQDKSEENLKTGEPNGNQSVTKTQPKDNQSVTKTQPKDNQSVTKTQPKDNQTVTKTQPNGNQNEANFSGDERPRAVEYSTTDNTKENNIYNIYTPSTSSKSIPNIENTEKDTKSKESNIFKYSFCPEPSADSGKRPEIVAAFALKDGSMYNVTENDVERIQQLYPGIDCMQELRKIVGWCENNPARRKTRVGAKRFLNGWMSRAQDEAARRRDRGSPPKSAYMEAIQGRIRAVDKWEEEMKRDGEWDDS